MNVTTIASARERYTDAELRAMSSVRSHARSLQLTAAQMAECEAHLLRLMRGGMSEGASIGSAKQKAECLARPAAKRMQRAPFDHSPQPAA